MLGRHQTSAGMRALVVSLLVVAACQTAPQQSRRPAPTRAGTPAAAPAVAPAAAPAGSVLLDPTRPDVTPAAVEARVHRRTNAARRSRSIPAVATDAALAAVARRHSADMAARDFFAHVTPDGLDPNARAARRGLDCRADVSPTETRVGFLENLYQGGLYRSATTTTLGTTTRTVYDWLTDDAIAATTVDGWLGSPGHRRNLLDGRMAREGIGVAFAPDGRVFVTQMLC